MVVRHRVGADITATCLQLLQLFLHHSTNNACATGGQYMVVPEEDLLLRYLLDYTNENPKHNMKIK